MGRPANRYRSITHSGLSCYCYRSITLNAETPTRFGTELRRRRTELRLSQQEIADVIGVNRRVIGELEAGKDTVQLKIALDTARALGLDLELRPRGAAS